MTNGTGLLSYWPLNVSLHECSGMGPHLFVLGESDHSSHDVSLEEKKLQYRAFSSTAVSQKSLEVAIDLSSKQQLGGRRIMEPQNLPFLAFSFKTETLFPLATYFNLLQGFPSNLLFRKMDSKWRRGDVRVMERGRPLLTSLGKINT